MRIGIDIDDVLGNLNQQIIKYHKKELNIKVKREDHKNFNFHESWNCSAKEAETRLTDFVEKGNFFQLEPMDQSIKSIKELKKLGHELVVITARNLKLYDDTINWLNKHYPELFSNIHFSQNKKQTGKRKWQICLDENIDVMVDDGPHIIKDCAKKGITSIILDAPWNQNLEESENIIRVNSWEEIVKKIKELEK